MATEAPLGTRIKRARERKRWSQQELADAIGVNRKTIDNWENGRNTPRSSIGALEDALGIRLTEPEPAAESAGDVAARLEQFVEQIARELRGEALDEDQQDRRGA